MAIRITLNNPNSKSRTRIAVYRADVGTEIPDPPIGEPHLDLDGYTSEILDKSTETGKSYNYRYMVYIPGGESYVSPQFTLQDSSLYGPGDFTNASGGMKNWYFAPEVLGDKFFSKEDLKEICAASDSDFLAWTDEWHKFFKDGDIYYTAAKGYIRLTDPTVLWNKLKAGGQFTIDGAVFEYATEPPTDEISAVLDAFVIEDNYNDPDFPRMNVTVAGAELAGVPVKDVYVIFSRRTNTNIRYFYYTNTNAFGRSWNTYTPTIDNTKVYLWKPMFKFVPNRGVSCE